MLTAQILCSIPVRSDNAPALLRKVSEYFAADAIDPLDYKCLDCGLTWDGTPLTDYRQVTCSNCYGERVVLTKVRLGFEDWGEQNGGVKQQRYRCLRARRASARAIAIVSAAEGKNETGCR